VAVREALRAIDEGLELPLEQGLALEADAFGRVANTEDSREGVSAFIGKRQPQFKDR
jgi:enoyl-CoA hydratase/carnithine racemase